MGTVTQNILVGFRRELRYFILWAPLFPFCRPLFILFLFYTCYLSDIFVMTLFLKLVQFMNAFDRAMNLLDDKFSFLASSKQIVSSADDEDKVNMPPNGSTILIII